MRVPALVFSACSSPSEVRAARLRSAPPVSQPAVVILHHVMELPVEQVASELGVPVGTVKSRLSRGRAALAPLLSEYEEIDHG